MFNSMNYVYEVYKERSFSKAAANLYISQPSLSATVKKVEERIGAPIFDRSVSPIQLTESGIISRPSKKSWIPRAGSRIISMT